MGSAITSTSLLIIVGGATCFGRYLTLESIPAKITEAVTAGIHSPMVFLLVINLAIGYCTPPVSLYIAGAIAKRDIMFVTKSAMPFLIIQIAVLFPITHFQELVMWLPRLFGFETGVARHFCSTLIQKNFNEMSMRFSW